MYRWASWSVGWIAFLFLLFACNVDKYREIPAEKLRFITTDASELFFKNIRQSSYLRSSVENSPAVIFKPDEDLPDDSVYLRVWLVANWQQDRAYAMVQPSPLLAARDTLHIFWIDTIQNNQGSIDYAQGNMHDQLWFLTELYHHVLKEHSIQIVLGDRSKPLFPSISEIQLFRKTMLDFYRLVEAV